ncbi:UDP-glucose 4-epimerase GalE [Hydrogenovibrio crunogenus]|nr:UDP-glucose 4-epimerase GalE [Hydrogenovibrio crunogenus]
MSKLLVKSGHEVIVLDNLSTGFRKNVKYGELVVGDLADIGLLENVFSTYQFDAVMHFAANSLVGESIKEPAKYYRNNVANTINLLDVMINHSVKYFIFSSTAATFGNPKYSPIDEHHPQHPINPYGMSKLMVENILKDYASAYDLSSVSLRYFNACGADPEGELGEMHDPETHLIPLVLQVASGRKKEITVFGSDYPTDDGTCIRDYIHVVDLCQAHLLAIEYLIKNKSGAYSFNLGSGHGFSVQEVLDASSLIVKRYNASIFVQYGDKRPGDPDRLVADSILARKILGWKPQYECLETIIEHAWRWELELVKRKKQ